MAPRAKILVISTAGARDRRNDFDGPGDLLPWSFFDALEIAHPDLVIDDLAIRHTLGRSLSEKEIGCYSSHYAVWKTLVEDENYDRFVVLEDDVMADWRSLKNILEHGHSMPDYLRLYYMRPVPFREVQREFGEPSKSLLKIYGYAFGTQAYIISKPAAECFLSACRVVERPIDDTMDRSWVHGVPSFAIFPFPVIEKSIPSSIGMERHRSRQHDQTHRRRTSNFLAKARFHIGRLRFIFGG